MNDGTLEIKNGVICTLAKVFTSLALSFKYWSRGKKIIRLWTNSTKILEMFVS